MSIDAFSSRNTAGIQHTVLKTDAVGILSTGRRENRSIYSLLCLRVETVADL